MRLHETLSSPRTARVPAAALLALLGGCGGAGDSHDMHAKPGAAQAAPPPPSAGEASVARFPDVLAAEATQAADGTWRFDVTLSSPYDAPERYADGWRVLTPEGEQLGLRVLTHDHASEQPFTRSLEGVVVPPAVTRVVVQGRDQESGWGGATVAVELTRR